MKCLDKVYEAYAGLIGEKFAQETRERVDWICGQIKGNQILDIGCSQGIVPLLLTRTQSDLHILGIDIEEESIAFAQAILAKEDFSDRLTFVCADFLTYDFQDRHYDCIIMTEVLEHLVAVQPFLERASALLQTGGTLVVTVPFGINDFPDHKRTYYLQELDEQVSAFFAVQQVKYMGKWIGLVAVKDGEADSKILELAYNPVLTLMEQNMYKIEREHIDCINSHFAQRNELKAQISANDRAVKQLTNEIGILKDARKDMGQKLHDAEQKYTQLMQSQEYRLGLKIKDIKEHPFHIFKYIGRRLKWILKKKV